MTLVRTDVSEERSVSITRVTRIGELGTTLTINSNRSTLQRNTFLVTANVTRSMILSTLMIEAICSSESFVLTRETLRHIQEDGILRERCF
jgi:hypothetical protein